MTAAVAPSGIALRAVTSLDLPTLAHVFREVHGEQFVAAGLSVEQIGPLLDVQFRSQQVQYGHEHPHAEDSLIELDGQVAGRCWVDRTPEVIRILDLAVLPGARRRGVASQVLRTLAEEAADRGCCLHLSVWRENVAARALYDGLGFGVRQERSDGSLELCRPTDPTTCPHVADSERTQSR